MRRSNRSIGIATALTLIFGGLVVVSTGTLLFLSLGNALDTTRTALASRIESLLNDAEQHSRAFFDPMEGNARWLANGIVAGRINPDDQDGFRSLLIGATATTPQIAAVSYQRPDGTGYFFDARTGVLKPVDWPPEWQARLNQKVKDRPAWPAPDGVWVLRPSVLDGKPAGTFLVPARTAKGDIGVIGVRRDLNPLLESLATDAQFRGYDLVRFLLFNNSIVIGHPLLQQMGDPPWPSIDSINDPYLKQLAKGKRSELNIVGEIPGVDSFILQADSGPRVFATRIDTNRATAGELMIGVHFDPQAGSAELNRLYTIAAIGAALLIGSVLVALFLGRRSAAPMERLSVAAQLVQNNKLDEVERLPKGSIRELVAATSAFNEMVDGLRERETIRDLFGKYVPQDVASLLLSDESNAEPRNTEATAFFLDLVGFSTISEKLTPAELVATINAFFSDAVRLIEQEGGMVTQFQGDAIVAVFNVPIKREDHAACAIRAALSIIDTIAGREYEGQKLDCRIGINSGSLVAGAIGAEDRLSYTVYGDAVNIAARLEQMNKEFGTSILLSAATVELVDGYDFKAMGSLPIRGRDAPVEVFTTV